MNKCNKANVCEYAYFCRCAIEHEPDYLCGKLTCSGVMTGGKCVPVEESAKVERREKCLTNSKS